MLLKALLYTEYVILAVFCVSPLLNWRSMEDVSRVRQSLLPLSPVATAVPLLILEISFHFSFKAICILWFFAMQAALQVIFMEGLQGASGNQKRPFGQPGWEKMIKKMSDWVAGMAILLKQSV